MRKWFIAVVCLQLLLIVASGVPSAHALWTGREVTLQAAPVDPHDLFRGEYARLSFPNINNIHTTETFNRNDRVYALLEQGPQHWRAVSLWHRKPECAANQAVIAGKVSYAWRGEVHVDYGIDRLYMPEGRSRNLERQAKNVQAIVAIDDFGNACIKRVLLNGRAIYDAIKL